MIGLVDRFKFGFTAKKRAKTLKKKGYRHDGQGNVFRVTGMGIERVGVKKSWF